MDSPRALTMADLYDTDDMAQHHYAAMIRNMKVLLSTQLPTLRDELS